MKEITIILLLIICVIESATFYHTERFSLTNISCMFDSSYIWVCANCPYMNIQVVRAVCVFIPVVMLTYKC